MILRRARIIAGAITTLALAACGASARSLTRSASTVSPSGYVTSMCSAVARLSHDGVVEGRRFSAGANGVRSLAHDKAIAEG